jgi:hypothetical protein
MIKGVVFACTIAITSTVAFAAARNASKVGAAVTAPAAPQPQGFCNPPGSHCAAPSAPRPQGFCNPPGSHC